MNSLSARPAPLDDDSPARAVYIVRDHYATMDSQLTVACDDRVELLNDRDRYWWLVRETATGRTGYVPADAVETVTEREARKNRERNVEITQVRPTDIAANMPWRRGRADSQEGHPGEDFMGATGGSKLATWQMSGFARRPSSGSAHLRSAPALEGNTSHTGGRHKKAVSFSKQQPEERTIIVEETVVENEGINPVNDSVIGELTEQMANQVIRDPEEGPLSSPVFQRDIPPLDPIVEKLLEREFGKPVEGEAVIESTSGVDQLGTHEEPTKFTNKEGWEGDGKHQWGLQHQDQQQQQRSYQQESLSRRSSDTKTSPTGNTANEPLLGDRGDLENYTFLDEHVRSLKPASAGKRGRFGKLFSVKLFGKKTGGSLGRSKPGTPSSLAALPDQQLLRVYAGNFTSLHGYKTLLVEEPCSMAEVAERACEKFALVGDGHDYVLNVVHFDSHEILPVAATTTLASVIEMAKRATIMEGSFAPETGRSWARLPRTARRRHEKRAKQHWQALAASTPGPLAYGGGGGGGGKSYINTPITPGLRSTGFSCLASPVIQLAHASEADLPRDRTSDFVTHYKFVLNRFLDGPAGTTPFYIKVQIMMPGSMSRAGAGAYSVEEGPNNGNSSARSSTSRASPGPATGTARIEGSIVKMLINTSMSVGELLRAALLALDVAPNVPGLKYEIYLACKPDNLRDRISLTRDMVVHDILHLKPMVDPSGLTLVLQPVVDSKLQMIVQ